MLFGFNTNATNIIINNLDAIDWIVLTDEDKITVYRGKRTTNQHEKAANGMLAVSFKSDKKSNLFYFLTDGIGANLTKNIE
jgi:hypothetical protein